MGVFKKWEKGISLRVIQMYLIVITVIMSGIIVFCTFQLTETFMRIVKATEEHIELEKAAHELMDASDYLTEQVQRFTVNGDIRFMNEYFTEAFETNRREEAIRKMSVNNDTSAALNDLREAMKNSMELMQREYYAMRLVIEAKGYTDYPDVLKNVALSSADAALSPDDKMKLATEMVLNDNYYDKKDLIRKYMKESLAEVDKLTQNIDAYELKSLHNELTITRIVVVLQVVSVLFMVWLTSMLGIKPVLTAVDKIRADSPIPETGANEFRYLAQAYNKMYAAFKNSLEHLNFKASHDELTGAYNRTGYDLLISTMDLNSTYMMLFDVDNFKSINDTYGHETGDKILKKLVQILKNSFREDDYICRIGGDEFVVFLIHSTEMKKELIIGKIDQINKALENPDDDLPSISISVGIVHGKQVDSVSSLFEKSDAAMYESKKKGKHTYTFYDLPE